MSGEFEDDGGVRRGIAMSTPPEHLRRAVVDPADVDAQRDRLRGAPAVVLWMLQEMGCWVVGSRAAFHVVRITPESDWDILVPPELWQAVVGGLPIDLVRPTKRGGWRFQPPFGSSPAGHPIVDVFPHDVGLWLQKPLVHVAWHPKTGTVIRKGGA